MNDLKRLLIWLMALAALAVGIWGFQRDEVTAARPFAPENRAFRLAHGVTMFGHEFALPVKEMALGWGGIALAGLVFWPLATSDRSRRIFGRWEKSHPR
jgi:hypothetical protein